MIELQRDVTRKQHKDKRVEAELMCTIYIFHRRTLQVDTILRSFGTLFTALSDAPQDPIGMVMSTRSTEIQDVSSHL